MCGIAGFVQLKSGGLGFDHAARLLSASRDQGLAMRLFPKLFPERGEVAEVLWAEPSPKSQS